MEHLKGTSTGNRSQAVHQSATLPKKKTTIAASLPVVYKQQHVLTTHEFFFSISTEKT